MTFDRNPFSPGDPDRHALWEMLVRRDVDAFIASDWSLIEDDFLADDFVGVDAKGSDNPDCWRITFPTLDAYRDQWLCSSRETVQRAYRKDPRQSLFEAISMDHIEIAGDHALLHKKFRGWFEPAHGEPLPINWQSLYRCRKINGQWKITGFTGYLPYPMGTSLHNRSAPDAIWGKRAPSSAKQHQSAGPYSPVLEIGPGPFVVISGQAAISKNGDVVGTTIEEQTELTLENCRLQLETAGSSLATVFKVNVYMTDLREWSRFNKIYERIMPKPYPVRTTVQTGLLPGLLVEIDMWSTLSK